MIHLVTGGSGSGKSAYAEQCILDFGGTRRVYIATMQPFGAEGQARIARWQSCLYFVWQFVEERYAG